MEVDARKGESQKTGIFWLSGCPDCAESRTMNLGTTLSKNGPVVKGRALSEVSERDAKWDQHRGNTQTIGALYDRASDAKLERLGERMKQCSGLLHFEQTLDMETGELGIKLDKAMFCKVRHCPVCQWRRGMANMARFYERLPALAAAQPKAQWLFLTLTVRNPAMANLRTTLRDMNAAWQRMIQRAGWPAKGFVRTTEVTKGKDGRPHPHFHCLLLVDPGYFQGKNYISQAKWRQVRGPICRRGRDAKIFRQARGHVDRWSLPVRDHGSASQAPFHCHRRNPQRLVEGDGERQGDGRDRCRSGRRQGAAIQLAGHDVRLATRRTKIQAG